MRLFIDGETQVCCQMDEKSNVDILGLLCSVQKAYGACYKVEQRFVRHRVAEGAVEYFRDEQRYCSAAHVSVEVLWNEGEMCLFQRG